MIRYFCDSCNKESVSLTKFSYLKHLDNPYAGGYFDNYGNEVSGVYVTVELCNYCYNDIVSKAVERFKSLKKVNENVGV